MTIKSLIFYISILLVGSFLFFSIVFTYGISSPFHVLITWLMYNNFLVSSNFSLDFDKNLFAFIPCVLQNAFILIYLFSEAPFNLNTVTEFYFSYIGLILIIVTVVEFWILRRTFFKYRQAKQISNN